MRSYDDNSDYEVNYIFHLLDADGDCLDQTSLIENSPSYALDLFLGQFGWQDRIDEGEVSTPVRVELYSFEDPDLYNSPDNFELSSKVREDGRKLCSACNSDKEDVAQLKTCPMYEDEEDADYSENGNLTCTYCWANGFYSVCENKPKEEI